MRSAKWHTLLDTNVHEVIFPIRRTVEVAVNVIAEAAYAQCFAN